MTRGASAVPSIRTEITEIATALGMLGYDSVERAMVHRPRELDDVDDATWARLKNVHDDPQHRPDFAGAFRNGEVFLQSDDALRGRRPALIEWKGGHRAPGAETVPVDLRVDHVFLVSCKYASRILLNSAPAALFGGADGDWYGHVASSEHEALYRAIRSKGSITELPSFASDLAKHHRSLVRVVAEEVWDGECQELYLSMAREVGRASASAWRSTLSSKRERESMLWRLLRIGSAPYFVLGSSRDSALRIRVTTPWDWRRRFEFRSFEVWGDEAGQPRVGWKAVVRDHELGTDGSVDGHVEVRWSHGRFGQPPEAKVYLDTPHDRVPGYLPLT